MSDSTKKKFLKYGISPPSNKIICPQCKSTSTSLVSEFGPTACKSFHKCNECLEPFEHFKYLNSFEFIILYINHYITIKMKISVIECGTMGTGIYRLKA